MAHNNNGQTSLHANETLRPQRRSSYKCHQSQTENPTSKNPDGRNTGNMQNMLNRSQEIWKPANVNERNTLRTGKPITKWEEHIYEQIWTEADLGALINMQTCHRRNNIITVSKYNRKYREHNKLIEEFLDAGYLEGYVEEAEERTQKTENWNASANSMKYKDQNLKEYLTDPYAR